MSDSNDTQTEELPRVDSEQIKEMIPHRYPFLLIDRVVDLVAGKSATGIKNVTVNEPHFPGHFPSQAVMPGVLIVEAMAQTSAVMVVHTLGEAAKGKLVYFMGIDEARFRKVVTPGDQLKIHIETIKNRGAVWKFKAEARVDGQRVADAAYSAMIMDKK